MAMDENIFKFLHKRYKRIMGKPSIWKSFPDAEVLSSNYLVTYSNLASALTNEKIDCKTIASPTELAGTSLFLPENMKIFPDKSSNLLAYKTSVLFTLEYDALGVFCDSDLTTERKILVCKNFTKVLESLFAKYPGFQKDFAKLATEFSIYAPSFLDKVISKKQSIQQLRQSEALDLALWLSIHPNLKNTSKVFSDDYSEILQLKPKSMEESPLWKFVGLPSPKQKSISFDLDVTENDALPTGTEKKGKNKARVKSVEVSEDREDENDIFHNFEKIETVEEFKGIQRSMDGEDEMMNHADALDELDLDQVIRSNQTSKSLYQAEVEYIDEINASAQEEIPPHKNEQIFFYPEWNFKNRSYIENWCKVSELRLSKIPIVEKPVSEDEEKRGSKKKSKEEEVEKKNYHAQVQHIKQRLLKASLDMRPKKNLTWGNFLDIDAYIAAKCSNPGGKVLKDNVYMDFNKEIRDLSIVVLLDLSMSADAWVNNRRVLDVCRDSLSIFGDAIEDLGDPILIASFNSNTRKDCRVSILKDFDESWNLFKERSAKLVPEGYTRMGPAIRHASHLLNEQNSRKKLLLIITDGKVTDLDKYEGHYGIKDVRKAIQESVDLGQIPYALAVDPQSIRFLPDIFSERHYAVLNTPKGLPEALGGVYEKLSRR